MTVQFDDGTTIRTATLSNQVVLKLVAWGARQAATQKDARDLALLLAASSSGIFGEALWDESDALSVHAMESEGHLPDLAGPRRVAAEILNQFSATTIARVTEVLVRDTELIAHSGGATESARQRVSERLEALARGLTVV